ncbi:MAG TPA: iron-sulfur cluster assembly protein [Sphingobacteriaceae bacterium]
MIIIDMAGIKDKVIEKLKMVFDPEIPVDIYELGLVYELITHLDGQVKILMTLTAPGCPASDQIIRDVDLSVRELEEVKNVIVEITFDPPWSKDMMSEEARLELGFL